MYAMVPMMAGDVSDALNLWRAQFDRYCKHDSFPDFANGGEETIKRYLLEQIEKGNAVVAKREERIVGYMAWMCFDFHSERTAFLPIAGHAASLGDEIGIYEEMYAYAAQIWVPDDRFNHLWMTYFDDEALKNRLYDLGFGSYVVDACQSTAKRMESSCDYPIHFATLKDADALLAFANTSTAYYLSSPLFLKRNPHTKAEMIELIENDYVLLAWDGGKIVGFMSFSTKQNFHFEHLTTPDSSARVGIFTDPKYRQKGIGSAMLAKAFEFCRKKGKYFIHVNFETANPNAIQFWPKYFRPAVRSVRRTVNKDANFLA